MIELNPEIILYITQNTFQNVNYLLTNKENYRYGKTYIDKIKIIYYLRNYEYTEFKKCLNLYNYNNKYKKDLLRLAIKDIPTIWNITYCCGYFNLYIIFELLYNQIYLSDDEIKELNDIFYKYFYREMQECIVKNNREETVININKSRRLISLRTDFIGYDKKTRSRVFYRIE